MQTITFELKNTTDYQLMLQLADRLGIKHARAKLLNKTSSSRKFGCLNGLVTYISKDFDAPLDMFKVYRPY